MVVSWFPKIANIQAQLYRTDRLRVTAVEKNRIWSRSWTFLFPLSPVQSKFPRLRYRKLGRAPTTAVGGVRFAVQLQLWITLRLARMKSSWVLRRSASHVHKCVQSSNSWSPTGRWRNAYTIFSHLLFSHNIISNATVSYSYQRFQSLYTLIWSISSYIYSCRFVTFRYNVEFILAVSCTIYLLFYAIRGWNEFVVKNIIYNIHTEKKCCCVN